MACRNFLTLLSLGFLLTFGSADSVNGVARDRTCVVLSQYAASNGTADDSDAVAQAFSDCSSNAIVEFSAGVDYNIFQPVSALKLSNVQISMLGNLHLPQNITAIQAIVNETTADAQAESLYWFDFAGPSLDYVSTSNVSTGWIYSYGQAWWDANPVNGTGTAARPHLISFDTTDGSMKYFKSRKPIAWNVELTGSNITVTNAFIDAYSVSGSFPFNTDGFDVYGTDISITNSVIYNGDDAIAVGSPSKNILFQGNVIGYQSHGMSIGSLGQNQGVFANVSNVLFDDNTCVNSVYGARFKSWVGGQGLAKNITWSNIRVYNVTFPIFVTQTYINQGSAQTQLVNGAVVGRPNNSSVIMEDFSWVNFTGTINEFKPGDGSCVTDPCWYNAGLPNLQHTEAVIIECNTNTSCSNFKTENVQVIPEAMVQPTAICLNATTSLNPDLGFLCQNGTFVPI